MRRLIRWWVARYIRNHMGHFHAAERDAVSAAKCAEGGVMEAMQNVPVPEWRRKELEAQKSA